MRTMIPASPGPTSKNQLNRPAGGSTKVAMHTTTTMNKSTKGVRKYDKGTDVMTVLGLTISDDNTITINLD